MQWVRKGSFSVEKPQLGDELNWVWDMWEPSLLLLQLLCNSKTVILKVYLKKRTMQNKVLELLKWDACLEGRAKEHENYTGLRTKILPRAIKAIVCGIST